MGRGCGEKRQNKRDVSGFGKGLVLLLGLSMGSCASTDPYQRVEEQRKQFQTELTVREAACLIGEVLAYEFPATQSNPSQPRALVWRNNPKSFEILYSRRNGSFLPSSNGFLHRKHGGMVQGQSIPQSFLGPIDFIEAPEVSGPIAPRETIRVQVTQSGKATLVRISTSLNLLHRNSLPLNLLRPLLTFSAKMKRLCREAPHQEAGELSRKLDKLLKQIGPGFSALQDDLLERSHLIHGNLLMRIDRRKAAWLAYQSAQFYQPGSGLSEKLRGQLLSANARPEEARLRLARSRLLAGPSSIKGRLLALEQVANLREAKAIQDIHQSLERGKSALLKGDWKTAMAFAKRSLNLDPGNTAALRLLASSQEVSGELKTALSTQLRVVASQGEDLEAVKKLADLLQKNGRPHLALGRLLRISDRHPNSLSTELAKRIYASISPLDRLRQQRITGQMFTKSRNVTKSRYARFLLLASPLGTLHRESEREAGSPFPLSQPEDIDLGPGIRTGDPATPGR